MNTFGSVFGTLTRGLTVFGQSDPNELLYAAKVSLWVRWFVLAACILETNYRVEYGAASHIFNNFYILGICAANGYVHYRVSRTQTVNPSWLLALAAMDVVVISISTSFSGGFSGRYFPVYYFAVTMFAWVFTRPYLILFWTTMVALIYSTLSVVVEPGISIADQEEKILFYRLVSLYAATAAISLITGFERARRIRAVGRELELQRQRIEISQTIHDTTAQSAYLINLGIETATELAGKGNEELTKKLQATAELSKSAMWELRHPIDGGSIFQGRELNDVLRTHVSTFTAITSVQAELAQRGAEPPLSTITRGLLFSIAHNALTNVFRHAQAGKVTVSLDFMDEELRMSVSDDGVGLPEDYARRGHGFRNMRMDAGRLCGRLEVESGGSRGGVVVACIVPYGSVDGGE